MKTTLGKFMLVTAASVAVVLLPDLAAAQAAPDVAAETDRFRGFFSSENPDYSERLMNQIFGPIFNGDEANTTVFGRMIGFFNIFALVLGAILFFYNVSVGILQSAHEGSVLGQRWSSLWGPLRTILAVGLLVPLPNYGGYNAMQGGIAYMVSGSTKVASYVWVQAFDMIVGESVPISGGIAQIDPDIAKSAFNMATCRAIANYQLEAAEDPRRVTVQTVNENTTIRRNPNWTPYGLLNDGPANGYSVASEVVESKGLYTVLSDGSGPTTDMNICGSITTPETPEFLNQLEGDGSEDLRNDYDNAYLASAQAILDQMQAVADARVDAAINNGEIAPFTEEIRTVLDTQNGELNQALSAIASARNGVAAENGNDFQVARQRIRDHVSGGEACEAGFSTQCHGEGWVGAGSWYMMIARINNEVLSLFNNQLSSTDPNYSAEDIFGEGFMESLGAFFSGNPTEGNIASESAEAATGAMLEAFDESAVELSQLGANISTFTVHQANVASDQSAWGRMVKDRLLSWTTTLLERWGNPSSYEADPIVGMIAMGHWLQGAGATIFAISFGGGFLTSLPFAGGAAEIVVSTLGSIAGALTVAGSILSLVMPMLPFLFWILAVTGYFLLVAEAMVAAPIWAVSHMRMDGEGISGESAKQGYMMVLALLLTPVLMIFGFVVGMMIFRVTNQLFLAGSMYALGGILGANALAFVYGLFTFAILQVLVYLVLLERSFSLIAEFPSRVLNWIGARADLTRGEEDRIRIAALGTGVVGYKTADVVNRVSGGAGRGIRNGLRKGTNVSGS